MRSSARSGVCTCTVSSTRAHPSVTAFRLASRSADAVALDQFAGLLARSRPARASQMTVALLRRECAIVVCSAQQGSNAGTGAPRQRLAPMERRGAIGSSRCVPGTPSGRPSTPSAFRRDRRTPRVAPKSRLHEFRANIAPVRRSISVVTNGAEPLRDVPSTHSRYPVTVRRLERGRVVRQRQARDLHRVTLWHELQQVERDAVRVVRAARSSRARAG